MKFSRLTEIIRDRHLSSPEVARLANLPEDQVAAISSGSDPTLSQLRAICAGLGISLSDVLPQESSSRSSQLLFRSIANKFKPADGVTLGRLSNKMDYSTFLLAESQPQPPRWIGRFTKGGTSYAEAELNATLFRKQFCDDDQLSPLYSLPKIVTHQMEILLFVVKGGRLDGASAFFAGLPFVFITERFAPRMLFTLAHELGHLLSHHDAHEDFAFVDRASETEVKGSHATEEQYAHAFASCLLMPRSGIGVALEKIRQMNKSTGDQLGDVDILFLARIYGVSFAAAAKRCEDLGLLPRGGANSLAQYLKAEYGSPEKRAEALGLPKRAPLEFPSIPEQLLGAAISKIRAGEISVGKAAAVLGLSVAELFAANTPTVH